MMQHHSKRRKQDDNQNLLLKRNGSTQDENESALVNANTRLSPAVVFENVSWPKEKKRTARAEMLMPP